jgi:hypothetical protein
MAMPLPTLAVLALLGAFATPALAKLPPAGDEAKAKAAEAAAKAAWGNKVADYQLCKAMDRTASRYLAAMKQAGKDVKPAVETPACVDPGPFAAPAPVAASAPKG